MQPVSLYLLGLFVDGRLTNMTVAIYGGCTNFPTPPRRTVSVELLETDQDPEESPPVDTIIGTDAQMEGEGSVNF